jgi:predicted DsbA family dithiol-disulfide isomerase
LKRHLPRDIEPGFGDYIQRFAAQFGVHDMKTSSRMPNTRRALAIAEFAREQGKLDAFRALAMDAHWKEGKDIEDTDVLRALAAASGIDRENALLAAEDPVYLGRVDAIRIEYKRVGTGGIPTFAFPTGTIEGCQPYENLAAAALRSGASRR